jgi:hypothetical protein
VLTDRRADARAEIDTVAVVLARHNAGVQMTIESLSVTGARLAGPSTFDVGERIQILFEIEGTPLDVAGEVVRVEHQDMVNDRIAVRFVDVEDTDVALIRRLVKQTLLLEELRSARAGDNDV